MNNDIKFIQRKHFNKEVCVVLGTRPGIIMLAPLVHELQKAKVPHFVIHTGQHYSPCMDSELFEDLELPPPLYHLKNVSERPTHAGQTAVMLEGVEAALLERKPSLVLVGGDANTNLAAALAARKLHISVGHIEAGERSFDWSMPEEHNRRIIDHISDHLFCTNEKGVENLKRESVCGKPHITGNTIVDSSLRHASLASRKSDALQRFGLQQEQYAIFTSHREENVDNTEKLRGILEGVSAASVEHNLPVVFLAHPRTVKRLGQFGLSEWADNLPGVKTLPALRYLDFMNLLCNSRMVFTDSGGVQQEAYVHKRPCVTLRENTEWTETMQFGGNRLAGSDPEIIRKAARQALTLGEVQWPEIFGDGNASARIVNIIKKEGYC